MMVDPKIANIQLRYVGTFAEKQSMLPIRNIEPSSLGQNDSYRQAAMIRTTIRIRHTRRTRTFME